MTLRGLTAALCAGAVVAGCSSTGSAGDLSAAAATRLQADVLAVTRAAAEHRWSAADAALTRLRGDLATALANGQISVERASTVRADAATVAADIAARRSVATHTSTPTSSRPSARPPAVKPPGHGKHGKHGKHD